MVTVLYFAACRERTRCDSETLDLAGKTVGEALDVLCQQHPGLAGIRSHIRLARNQAFAPMDETLAEGDELALIPPVAGGTARVPWITVQDEPLQVDPLLDNVAHDGAGAQVVMIGTVRDHAAGEGVERLEYEAYVAMAEKVIGDIVRGVEAEFEGVRAACAHRIGKLAIGDRAVVVATSSPHRQEAFLACQAIIDRLKEDAPIWKHEHRSSGVVWVGLGP